MGKVSKSPKQNFIEESIEGDGSDTKVAKEARNKVFIEESIKREGSIDVMDRLLHVAEKKDDETLIDIKVTNPLHKIVQILQEIKKHQSTTFSFRFTIPLIALPIFLFVAFQLGRVQSSCGQMYATRLGVIRSIVVDTPKENPNWWSQLFAFMPSVPPVAKASDLQSGQRTILIGGNNEIVTVLPGDGVNVSNYQNQPVLITGNYSSCTHIITLDSAQNITPLAQ